MAKRKVNARKKATKKPRKKAPARKARPKVKASQPIDRDERRFRIEDDMRTLARAEEVRSSPERLTAVQKELQRLTRVAGGAKNGS